jgi:hypothetical protein
MNIEKFKNQCYSTLKKSLLKDKTLFEDPHFPAEPRTIYLSKKPDFLDGVQLCWKRPSEIFKNPKFSIDGFSRKDLHQGKNLGFKYFYYIFK